MRYIKRVASRETALNILCNHREGKGVLSEARLCMSTTNADVHKLKTTFEIKNSTNMMCNVQFMDVKSVTDAPSVFIQSR
jgi:hypothetical protein